MAGVVTLADRCEAATGPDRELDALIWCFLNGKRYIGHNQAYGSEDTQVEFTEPPKRTRKVSGSYGLQHALQCTKSLDAAMTLVPDGCQWRVDSHHNMAGVFEYYTDNEVGASMREYEGEGHTPALALCAAALRARA